MAPAKAGRYEFRPDSLVHLREQMGMRQAKMAGQLGVPPNTLSRWETGATSPDANSLAAIYSIAMQKGITPKFFQRRRPTPKRSKERSRLLVMWDFQDVGAHPQQVEQLDSWIRAELDRRFGSASDSRFKAFAHPQQNAATDELLNRRWDVWEDDIDIDEWIADQARSDCGQAPADTTFVLITKEGRYDELLNELGQRGTSVYLLTPSHSYSPQLVQVVGHERWIRLPGHFAVSPPMPWQILGRVVQ